jgi:D-lactate dehydrogenase
MKGAIMKIGFFDTHSFDKDSFEKENGGKYEIVFFGTQLNEQTAILAKGFEVICVFVNDRGNAAVLKELAANGTKLLALRSAGFNHVDIEEASRLGMKIVRVPEYSPHAVAEHALALLLSLNRKIHRAYQRVRELNFSLDGLVGYDLYGKTVGVVGTGRIGTIMANLFSCLGCKVLAFDLSPNPELEKRSGVRYAPLEELYRNSDVLTLHVPLNPKTHHLLNEAAFDIMKDGVTILNTGRGALIDTQALVRSLKNGKVAAAGLDVYEEEESVFFKNLSDQVLQDDTLARLLTFPNVLITSHQGFLTKEALSNIAETTLLNVQEFIAGGVLSNEVTPEQIQRKSGS